MRVLVKLYFNRFAAVLTQEKRFTSQFFLENVQARRLITPYTSVQTGSEDGVMDMKT